MSEFLYNLPEYYDTVYILNCDASIAESVYSQDNISPQAEVFMETDNNEVIELIDPVSGQITIVAVLLTLSLTFIGLALMSKHMSNKTDILVFVELPHREESFLTETGKPVKKFLYSTKDPLGLFLFFVNIAHNSEFYTEVCIEWHLVNNKWRRGMAFIDSSAAGRQPIFINILLFNIFCLNRTVLTPIRTVHGDVVLTPVKLLPSLMNNETVTAIQIYPDKYTDMLIYRRSVIPPVDMDRWLGMNRWPDM